MAEIRPAVLFGKLNTVAYKALEGATVFCKMRGNPQVELLHWIYQLVQVPIGVVNGFTAVGGKQAIVANCASIGHDPTEIVRIDPFTPDIPYDWRIKHG